MSTPWRASSKPRGWCEAGFAAVHPNRSTWAECGKYHLIEAKHGVTLCFLPAYSPELNRIERLWHQIKYTWMAVKCRTAKELEADVGEILENFGTTYKFDFYSR